MPPTIIPPVRAPPWQRKRFSLSSLILFRRAGVQFRIHLLYLAECSVTWCATAGRSEISCCHCLEQGCSTQWLFSLVVDRNPSTSTFCEWFWINPSRSNTQAHSKSADRLSWDKDVWSRLNVQEAQYSGINPHFYCLEAAFLPVSDELSWSRASSTREKDFCGKTHKKTAQWSVSTNILAVFHHSDVKWDDDRSVKMDECRWILFCFNHFMSFQSQTDLILYKRKYEEKRF